MNTKLIFGLLAGATVGAAIAIYAASEEGSEARKRLKTTLDEIGDQFNDVLKEGKKKYHEIAGDFINVTREELKKELKSTGKKS